MNSTRFKKDSYRFKKEASLCELAARIAEFLETSTPVGSYDFALPDLLYFSDEKALLKLRENPDWQALEAEFIAHRGIIAEDWDLEGDSAEIEKPVKVLRPVSRWESRIVGLLLIVIIPAIIGGTLGWFKPLQLETQPNCKTVIK